MDFAVYPNSRIARMPRGVQIPALLLRNLFLRLRETPFKSLVDSVYGFGYHSNGLATAHYSPFLSDKRFNELYDRTVAWWWPGQSLDIRWRVWFLTRCAEQCKALPGSFVEFGVYRAGYAFMVLATAGLPKDTRFYLFDTFTGIPATRLTEAEAEAGFAGRLADTSVAFVNDVLNEWRSNTLLVEGDIFDTLSRTETGPVAFCHLDLNGSAPTKRALEYVYPRLLPGAMIVMDDYGLGAYTEQRQVIDEFFVDKPECPIALPTGQGLVVKT